MGEGCVFAPCPARADLLESKSRVRLQSISLGERLISQKKSPALIKDGDQILRGLQQCFMQFVQRSQLRLQLLEQIQPPGKIRLFASILAARREPRTETQELLGHAAFHANEVGGVDEERSDQYREQHPPGRQDSSSPNKERECREVS